jgi:hypothetical protein
LAIAIGNFSNASGDGSLAVNRGTASGSGSIAFGSSNAGGIDSFAVGTFTRADGNATGGIAIGDASETSTAPGGGAIIYGAPGANIGQVAVGASSRSYASGAVAVGGASSNGTFGAVAGGFQSTAIGSLALAGAPDGFNLAFQNSGTTAIGALSQAGAGATGQINATAVGFSSKANAASATALGANAAASGVSSLALGDSASASATGAVAVGLNSRATGVNAIAIGAGATATGSIAVGVGASAANGGAAFGDGASATFANSSAIGPGASATRANQVMLGTASNTYTLAGVSSAASLAAQSGPTRVVTADANGNLATATFSPGDISTLQANVGVLQSQMKQAFEGTAIAVAMAGSSLPSDKRFAISSNWGTFRGQNAGSFLAQARVNDYVVLNGGVGFGFAQGGVAGRGGVTLSW